MEQGQVMQLAYDHEADVLYISLGEPRPAILQELGDDVLLRRDVNTGEIIGLTVLHLSTRGKDEPLPVLADLYLKNGPLTA